MPRAGLASGTGTSPAKATLKGYWGKLCRGSSWPRIAENPVYPHAYCPSAALGDSPGQARVTGGLLREAGWASDHTGSGPDGSISPRAGSGLWQVGLYLPC